MDTCNERLGPNLRCALPAGHYPGTDHRGVQAMPQDVARLFGGLLESLDAEVTAAKRYRRRLRWAFWALAVSTGLNLGCAVTTLILGAASAAH